VTEGTTGYGLPLKCPKCPEQSYYGILKFPGGRSMKCDDHGAVLDLTNGSLQGPVKCRAKKAKAFCGKEMHPVKPECGNCGTRLTPARARM
jgi:hypothetical protein